MNRRQALSFKTVDFVDPSLKGALPLMMPRVAQVLKERACRQITLFYE